MEGYFSGVEEEAPISIHVSVPIWRLIVSCTIGIVAFVVIAMGICLFRDVPPSLHNMLSDKTVAAHTGPFIITAVNMLQAMHFVMAAALYHRTLNKAGRLAVAQLLLAVATHVALLLVLFLLPFVGWNQDWAVVIPVYTWAAWEGVVLLCLRAFYMHSLPRERRYLLLSAILFILYSVGAIAYTVISFLPPPHAIFMELLFSAVEGIMILSVLGFLGLLIIHTRRVYVTMFVSAT